jgi:iron complex outermembrane receptor protein
VRDPATGVLTGVDIRPVQFAREDRKELRYGFNLNLPLGGGVAEGGLEDEPDQLRRMEPVDRPRDRDRIDEGPGADRADRGPGDGRWAGRGERGGRGGFGRGGGRGPRLQFNLSHTIALESELQIREGLDPIDLLSRGAIGLGGATRPRHQLDFSAGYAERGRGVRLTGRHQSESFLRLTGGQDTQVLRFSPLTTLNLRAFTELGRYAPDVEFLKGARLSLSIANIFNRRQKIRDEGGITPLAYQRAYRDPIGRTVELELRKTF